jgi:hypothetical protein
MTFRQFLKGMKEGMHLFGQNIAIIINTALLLAVYLIGVGITSLIAKICGKKFLDMKQGNGSYWKPLNLKKKQIDEYYRQF